MLSPGEVVQVGDTPTRWKIIEAERRGLLGDEANWKNFYTVRSEDGAMTKRVSSDMITGVFSG